MTLENKNWGESLILNPFDADIDMREIGEIRHIEIDPELLYSIGESIRGFCEMESYTPKWAHVVTWYETRSHVYSFYPSYKSRLLFKNTFQLLMVTDGTNSFAFYNYVRMEWPNDVITSDLKTGYKLISKFFTIYHLAFVKNQVNYLVNNSNIRIPGRWFMTFKNPICFYGIYY